MSSRVSVLPPELDYHLMSFLEGNKHALRACALTCHSWFDVSRPYIFREVTVRSESQFRRLNALLDTAPEVGDYVQTLRIQKAAGRYGQYPFWVNDCLSSLPTLPLRLHKVQTIDLQRYDERLQPKAIETLSCFTSVTRLYLSECALSSSDLFWLLSSLPLLKEFGVKNCTRAFSTSSSMISCPYEIALERLTVDSMELLDKIPLFSWVLSTNTCHTLRYVDFCVVSNLANEMGQFLRALGPSLEELSLSFRQVHEPNYANEGEVSRNLDLRYNTNIYEITFNNTFHPSIPKILSTISSSNLNTISFRISDRALASSTQHKRIEEVLSTVTFTSLTNVRFTYYPSMTLSHAGGAMDQIPSLIRKAYPSLEARGILHVQAIY